MINIFSTRSVRWALILATALLQLACSGSDEEKPRIKEAADGGVRLGILADSSVELYRLDAGTQNPFSTPLRSVRSSDDSDILSRAGRIEFEKNILDSGQLYLLRVSGGKDLDVNNDLVMDAQATPVYGTMHALITGAQLLNGNWSVNVLTEIVYRQLSYEIALGATQSSIVAGMEAVAQTLISAGSCLDPEQINCSAYGNVLNWSPGDSEHRGRVLRRLALIDTLTAQLRAGGILTANQLDELELSSLATSAEQIDTLNMLSAQNSNSLLSFIASGMELNAIPVNTSVLQMQFAEIEDINGNTTRLAFVLDSQALRIIDVTSPANARVLAVDNLLETEAGADEFVAMAYVGEQGSGNLYLLLEDNTLQWYRIADFGLGADFLHYEKRISGSYTGVNAVSGTEYLYVSNDSNQLFVYAPGIDPELTSPVVTTSFYDNLSLNISDDRAFFRGEAISGEGKVGVLDLSNPLSPAIISEETLPGGGYPWGPQKGYVVGDTVIVAAEVFDGFFVDGYIQRRAVNNFSTVLDEVELVTADGAIVVREGRAYVTGGTTIDVFDIADLSFLGQLPAARVPIAAAQSSLFTYTSGTDPSLKLYNLDGEFPSSAVENSVEFGIDFLVGIASSGDRLYFTSYWPDGAKYFITSYIDLPGGDKTSSPNWQTAGDIHFNNNYAYFIAADAEIWPSGDPGSLEVRHTTDALVDVSTAFLGTHLGLSGDLLLLFNDTTLTRLSIATPDSPASLGTTNLGGEVTIVNSVDDRTYAVIETATDTLIQRYDATGGTALVSEIALGIDPNDVAVAAITAAGDLAYVLLDQPGVDAVLAIDFSSQQVVVLDFSSWLGPTQQITHLDGCYALSDNQSLSIIAVFNICKPSGPQLLGNLRGLGRVFFNDGVLLIGATGGFRSRYSLYRLPSAEVF